MTRDRIIVPFAALYSTINTYTPQCSDLTEDHRRLMRRVKQTTIKTNEPAYRYHGRMEQEMELDRVAKGTKPYGEEPHVCADCAPLPLDHPEHPVNQKGANKKRLAKQFAALAKLKELAVGPEPEPETTQINWEPLLDRGTKMSKLLAKQRRQAAKQK